MASSPLHSSSSISPLGSTRGIIVGIPIKQSMSALFYTMGNPLPPENLGLDAFNHLWKFRVSYVFVPPVLVPLVLSRFLTEQLTSQSRLVILVSPYWMEAFGFPTVLSILEDIPYSCLIMKGLIMDV